MQTPGPVAKKGRLRVVSEHRQELLSRRGKKFQKWDGGETGGEKSGNMFADIHTRSFRR